MKSLTYFSNFNKAISETDGNNNNDQSSSTSKSKNSNERTTDQQPSFALEHRQIFPEKVADTFQPILNQQSQQSQQSQQDQHSRQITNTVKTQILESKAVSTDKIHTKNNSSGRSISSTISGDSKNNDNHAEVGKS